MSWLDTRLALAALAMLAVESATAGAVVDQFKGGAFGLPWNAGRSAIEAKYAGGRWDQDDQGRQRCCAKSQQSLLKLAAQYKTRELCFLVGADGTLASARARLAPTPSPAPRPAPAPARAASSGAPTARLRAQRPASSPRFPPC